MNFKSFFALLLAGLCFCACTKVKYVYVEEDGNVENTDADGNFIYDICVYMPDISFREFCYNSFDKDKNGAVSSFEADEVSEINLSRAYCFDLTGIEYFHNLTSFSAERVEKIDLSQNTKLKYLSLAETEIATIDLSHNTELEEIDFRNSFIEQLDLSHNTKLTSIRDSAFFRCYDLTAISLPNSLTSIGSYAFQSCDLKSITVPEGVTCIGDYAFQYNYYITSISLPSSLEEIGDTAFYYISTDISVSVKATTPPKLNGHYFNRGTAGTLYVPSESIEKYAEDKYWANCFAEILPLEE